MQVLDIGKYFWDPGLLPPGEDLRCGRLSGCAVEIAGVHAVPIAAHPHHNKPVAIVVWCAAIVLACLSLHHLVICGHVSRL